MKIIKLITALLFATLFTITLHANQEIIGKIESKINSVQSGVLMFLQEDENGNEEEGVILFSKPGKARVEYTKSPIAIIANASSLVVYNKQDDTKSYIPSSSVPIVAILSQKNLNFNNDDFKLVNFAEREKSYALRLASKNSNLGYLTMFFNKQSLNIESWVYRSQDGAQNIKVTILNQIDNKKLDNSIFNVNRIKSLNIKEIK